MHERCKKCRKPWKWGCLLDEADLSCEYSEDNFMGDRRK